MRNLVSAALACLAALCVPAELSAAPPAAKPCAYYDVSDIIARIDTDHDGKLTREEWLKAGAPISSFNGLSKGRGYVTKSDFDNSSPPPGIDANGDCHITLKEFKDFDKRMSPKMHTPPPPT